jgi:hypothetical protein
MVAIPVDTEVTAVAELSLDCPTCDVPIRVKLTFGDLEGNSFPISVRFADVEAALLEHALTKRTTSDA